MDLWSNLLCYTQMCCPGPLGHIMLCYTALYRKMHACYTYLGPIYKQERLCPPGNSDRRLQLVARLVQEEFTQKDMSGCVLCVDTEHPQKASRNARQEVLSKKIACRQESLKGRDDICVCLDDFMTSCSATLHCIARCFHATPTWAPHAGKSDCSLWEVRQKTATIS